MKHKSKSKSGNKTQKNPNQGGNSNEPKTFKSKSNGAKEQLYNPGNVTHNSNENAWNRSRHSSVSDMWSDADEHFPALGASAASGPKVNVWEERKTKQEAIKALEPQNEYDEEAMFQHALALSLLEEQRKKEAEEDYIMQMETLQFSSENVEDFVAPDEFIMEQASNFQDDFSVKEQHQIDNYSRNFVSKNSQRDKTLNCEETKFQDDCFAKEEYQLENHSRSSISNNCQKEKNYNSVGARPKINKAIEAFGGWGLKDNKKRNNSEKITEFIDDVVSEKSNSYKTYNDQKNIGKPTKENSFSTEENSLHSCDSKNNKKSASLKESDDKDEVLYDEKGTFLDYDDSKWNDSNYETVKVHCVSPNTALDTWLNTKDADDLNDEILNKNKVTTVNDNFIPSPSFSDRSEIDDDINEIVPTSNEFSIPTINRDFESKSVKNPETLSQETSESIKNVWSNATNFKDQELSENKNSYNYDACNLNGNTFTPFHEPTEVPTLSSCKIWSDKSSSDSSYFSSFSDNLTGKLESVKLSSDIDNEVFNIASCNDSDVPPIPPPQPPATASTVNECNGSATGIPNSNCEIESPPTPQPQPVPEMQVPQFPAIVNPILNPMFPAFNPMLGCGVDPLLMRQMLILTNPFLANQLIAMEQYYRSMGVPVDLFSMSAPMPNVSGMMNPSLLQNPIASNVNGNIQQLQSEIQHLQTQIDANAAATVNKNTAENLEQISCKKSHEPPGMDAFSDFSNSAENSNDDPWFKSYLSNDDASIIPPPKPPSNEVNYNNNLMSVPQKSESSQIGSSYDKFAHSHASDNQAVSMSNTHKDKEFRLLAAPEPCITKKEVDGWGDHGFGFAGAQNLKSHTWDDGWDDPIAPPKPLLRNPSLQEDKKKTIFRQPAKQPQIGRYQKNISYS